MNNNAEPRPPLRHPGGRLSGPVEKPKKQTRNISTHLELYAPTAYRDVFSMSSFVIIASLLSLVGPLYDWSYYG